MTSPQPSKETLRRTFLKKRTDLSPVTRQAAASNVFDVFFKNVDIITPQATIAGYWPIRGELDDMSILRELLRRGNTCALPYIVGEGMPLVFRVWNEKSRMITNKYTIPEPDTKKVFLPDIILVPMAAFDKKLNRLGYGAGFYDRTLAYVKGRKKVLAIGLAYEEQLCDALPADANDVKMDMIVTDRNVYT